MRDSKELAMGAINLLTRVEMKGAEVPAFIEIVSFLEKIRDGALKVEEKKKGD